MVQYIKATVLLLLLITQASYAQDCVNSIGGSVHDKERQPVIGAIVYLKHVLSGTATDTNGHFIISHICPGVDTLICAAIGYDSIILPVHIEGSKEINITLAGSNQLHEVVVSGERLQDLHTVIQTEIAGVALLQTRGESLGETLKELPGLNSIQTGPTLSKPVIHGLSSNRVLLINNDVRQEGQQWGSEHAPEIDPFVANKISVIKGAAAVRYGSDAIAGVVLLSPDALPVNPGISGDIYLIGTSNGQLGGLSASLQGAFGKGLKGLSWRIQGTGKYAGNFRTPEYYLINSGLREGDFSANIAYTWKGFDLNVYYSQYNMKVGIFAGAESGNLQELQEKFSQSRPNLPSYFTYDIGRSYQVVYHELLKASISHTFHSKGKLEMTFGRQNDKRKEYDSDLPFTTNPALLTMAQLSFQLITHTLDVIYTQAARHGFSGSVGITGNTSGNVYEGIRYLIPNFRDYNSGAFAIERYNYKKLSFEVGVRYDYRWLRVYQRNPTSLVLYNSTYTYNNATATAGVTYRHNEHLSASLNVGSAWRAPSINEMYINGEHFSDASYEIGDSSLKSERSVNTGLSINYKSSKFRAIADVYYNHFGNYIYEQPALRLVATKSGYFPLFFFTEAKANIQGADISLQYEVLPRLFLQSKTTIVRGYNETIHDWLISMPADRFQNGVEYHFKNVWKLSDPYMAVENISVWRQTREPPNSDYVPPPAGYSLFNINAGFTLPIRKNILTINFAVDNVTNHIYRDYLDHFRYYADELGINYILRLKYSF